MKKICICIGIIFLCNHERNKMAKIMKETGKFHAYYLDGYKAIINEAVEDMLVEANPINFLDFLKKRTVLDAIKNNFIELLNLAWSKFRTDTHQYYEWERRIVNEYCS